MLINYINQNRLSDTSDTAFYKTNVEGSNRTKNKSDLEQGNHNVKYNSSSNKNGHGLLILLSKHILLDQCQICSASRRRAYSHFEVTALKSMVNYAQNHADHGVYILLFATGRRISSKLCLIIYRFETISTWIQIRSVVRGGVVVKMDINLIGTLEPKARTQEPT